MKQSGFRNMTPWRRRPTVLWLSLVFLFQFFTFIAGCRNSEIDEPEHHFPAHKPADYPAAVARLQHIHQEIITGPLVAREVHATHHHHDHPHDHDHRHSHGRAHQHVHLDALQEMSDLVRWLPDLAADSDLKEAPWNQVYDTVNRLEVILAKASSRNGDERRETYLEYQTEVDRRLRQLIEIKRQFPSSEDSLAAGQQE